MVCKIVAIFVYNHRAHTRRYGKERVMKHVVFFMLISVSTIELPFEINRGEEPSVGKLVDKRSYIPIS